MNPPFRGAGGGSSADGPLSLAFFSPAWPPGHDPNGVVTYVGTITERLRARGHTTSVLTHYPAGDLVDDGIYSVSEQHARRTLSGCLLDRLDFRVNPDRAFERIACRSLVAAARRAIAGRGAQLLEMEESFGVPFRVRRRLPIPIVVRLHGPWFLVGPSDGQPADARLHHRIRKEGLAIGVADGITAPSRDVLERTRSYYGLALEQAEVIPNPVPAVPASERWSLAGSDPHLILYIGRFDLLKGGHTIIDAFSKVVERVPQARLRFVGSDRGIVDADGKRWMIREYADDRLPGARQRGQFEWLGQQPHAALAGLRRQAAVTVVCSRYETFGLTATEAMSQGCPLVATNAGALPEIVQDGDNGLLCRSDDPGDLAEKVCRLLGDRPYAARLGQRAAVDCQRRYHPGLLATQSVEYYRRVIAGARTKRSHFSATP